MTRAMPLFKSILVSCLFFVAFALSTVNAGGGSQFYFVPSSSSLTNNSDLQVTVKVDVGSDNAFGADATVTYPSSDLSVKSIENGGFFNDFTYAQGDGRLELHGFMSIPFASKTGEGDFAKITFTSKKDSGTGQVNFLCTGEGETQIIDIDGNDVFDCNYVNQLIITFIGSDTNNSGFPPGYSEPNSCGGTCGSNYNCGTNLFCNTTVGFCRNSDCPDDISCECKATPTPTAKSKVTTGTTTKGSTKATPQVVTLTKATPYPTFSPFTPMPEEQEVQTTKPSNTKGTLIAISLILIAVAAIIFIVNKLKKGSPPKIEPPSTFTTVQPPFPTQI